MFKVQLVSDMCGQITVQGQLLRIRDKNIQTCLQLFVKLMHYFTKFAKFFIKNCKFDIKLKIGKNKFLCLKQELDVIVS